MLDHSATYRGIVRGQAIELDRAVGLPDGQVVTVIVQAENGTPPLPGEGLRRAFGGWADDDPEGLEQFLEWNRQRRKQSRREMDE